MSKRCSLRTHQILHGTTPVRTITSQLNAAKSSAAGNTESIGNNVGIEPVVLLEFSSHHPEQDVNVSLPHPHMMDYLLPNHTE